MERNPKCPECGYTAEDAATHLDHRLCRNDGNAPWQAKPFGAEQLEKNKRELLAMLSNAKRDQEDLAAFRALAKRTAEALASRDKDGLGGCTSPLERELAAMAPEVK